MQGVVKVIGCAAPVAGLCVCWVCCSCASAFCARTALLFRISETDVSGQPEGKSPGVLVVDQS